MKILFIYPNSGSQIGFNYGVAHISAVLKQAGHNVELIQFCEGIDMLLSKTEFINKFNQTAPDLVGFSVVTNQWGYAKQIAKWIIEISSVPLICGGIHTMAAPEEILQTGLFDYIIRGEAEEAFLEFVEKFQRGEEVVNIKNLGFCKNGQVKINPMRLLPDLTMLPFKDYDIFNFQKIIDAKNGWVGLMASRGCPFSCTYCFNHQMVTQYRHDLNCTMKQLNYIRHFNLSDIIYEIEYLLKRYNNINTFIFDDDLFTFYKDYVIDFCREYKKISSIPFVVNAHVGFFDEQRASSLADARCKIVKFGVESGSSRIRQKVLKRRMSNKTIIDSISVAKKYKLHTSVFLMIGLPGETSYDLMETINLMGKSLPGRYRWSFFFPFPKTAAYDIAVEAGLVNYEKMVEMVNFTEGTCLDFNDEHSLLLKKVGRLMPWFVNAASDLPVADFYKDKVNEILSLNTDEWEKRSDEFYAQEGEISKEFVKKGLSHYAIKYNPFMGVISDYFIMDGA
ncbi:MAG TPA: hypothetical protein DD405_08060 [Desulfobacteraceae bacterium]|nr:hypothetical protein [Desulfobacteraceae bacterium]